MMRVLLAALTVIAFSLNSGPIFAQARNDAPPANAPAAETPPAAKKTTKSAKSSKKTKKASKKPRKAADTKK